MDSWKVKLKNGVSFFFSLFLVFLRIEISAFKGTYLQGLSKQFLFSVDINYYISTKAWRGSIFTAVCLCVRLCLWTKFLGQPNRWTDLDAVFAKRLISTLARTLLKLVTLGQRSRSQWLKIHFFFIILLTSLMYISALVCLTNLKFDMTLWYALCRFV